MQPSLELADLRFSSLNCNFFGVSFINLFLFWEKKILNFEGAVCVKKMTVVNFCRSCVGEENPRSAQV